MGSKALIAVWVAVVFAIGCFVGANFPRSRPTTDFRLNGSWRSTTKPQVKLVFDDVGTFFILEKGVPLLGARGWNVDGNIGYFESIGDHGERRFEPSPYRIRDGKLSFESFGGVGGSHDFVRVGD